MDPDSLELVETLRTAQRLGFLGSAPVERVIVQGRLFAAGLDRLDAGDRVVDLGSGGGSPGLVVAALRPDLSVTLIDRRRKRTDFLLRAVSRLRLTNTDVRCDDVNGLIAEVRTGASPAFEGLTARGFGPFELLVSAVIELLQPGGVGVISDAPGSDRWSQGLVDVPVRLDDHLRVENELDGGVALLLRLPD